MNTKTMEGIVGARTNMNLLNTPMRVYREARRRGDTAAMDRAIGYADEYADRAEAYKAEADKGMEEDAKEAREKVKSECEKAIRKRKEEREKLEDRMEKNGMKGNKNTDTVEVSGEGEALLKGNADLNFKISDETEADAVKEPIIYTKMGGVSRMEQSTRISISV